MDIEKMFERGVENGLFTDFDVCVRGRVNTDFSGGRHVSVGARLFDVSSLTKALTYLIFWKLFANGELSPEDRFADLMPDIPGVGDRRLWHFMSYLVQGYGFDHENLRDGLTGPCKDVFLTKGFGEWQQRFRYDNFASVFLGLFLEQHFGVGIEDVLHQELVCNPARVDDLRFHPVRRGLVSPEFVVPTRDDLSLRGLVHDPFSYNHPREHLAAAGLFSTARAVAEIFHCQLAPIIQSGFYDVASRNQLEKVGDTHNEWALGFDIPYPESLEGVSVQSPLMFAGWTGCRVFFAKDPRVTIAITTNRVFCGDSPESRQRFTQFFWGVVREVLR